jgi:peptidoglycan/xylan/chitin deacetylase (PgdA/CDA1 family)
MTPHRTPFFLPWLYPALLWRMPTQANDVYLTFDDGPVPGPTDFALDTLQRHHAQATFFCIGDNIRKHPDLFPRIPAGGHAVGNHTFHHLNGWHTRAGNYVRDVADCDAMLGLHTVQTKLFRPPYGQISRRQISQLQGRSIVMWDVLSVDYNRRLSPEACLRNTMRAVRPGSIVVFHDSYKAEKNMTYALPRLMDHLGSAGYSFKALPG